jgi:hypothetical protein
MNAIETRTATPNYADAVADYHDLCFRDTYASQLLAGEFEVPDLEGTRQQLRDWFRPGSELVTQIAVLDGTPIGHFTVSGHTDYELHARVENVEAIAFYKKAGWTVTDRLIHTAL